MRISDWSSDVCSSDLPAGGGGSEAARRAGGRARLEMAVHLSRTGRRDGERAGAAGEPAGPFPYLLLIGDEQRSEEHTSELQSLMRLSYAVFCLKKKTDIVKKQNKIIIDAKRYRRKQIRY